MVEVYRYVARTKAWKTPGGKDFKVELVLIDDPIAMRDAYAARNLHVGWATLDMLPLFLEGLRKDSRVMPRVFQQIDWSNGGDGIVVRDPVKTMADLRGKTIVLAQHSPSHFFVLNALINAGVQPADKKINAVTEQTPFDQVMDFTVIQKLGAEPPYCFLSSQLTSVMASIFRKPGFWSKAEKYTYRTSSGVSSEWSTGTPDSLSFQPAPAFSLAKARGCRPPLGGFVPSNATHNQNSGLEPLLGNH